MFTEIKAQSLIKIKLAAGFSTILTEPLFGARHSFQSPLARGLQPFCASNITLHKAPSRRQVMMSIILT